MTLRIHSIAPYPVLCAATGDYIASSQYRPETKSIRQPKGDAITIAIRHHLASPGIQGLIDSGQARYATHAYCGATRKRLLDTSDAPAQTIRLPDAEYQGITSITPVIVAAQDIPAFTAPDWTPGVKAMLPQGIRIPAGTLLAVHHRTSFDTDALEGGDSFVQLIPSNSVPQGQWDYDISGDRLVIQVNLADWPEINRMRQHPEQRYSLWPSIYLGAIERGVRNHRKEAYRSNRWARNIERQIRDSKLPAPADQDELDELAHAIAQQLLDNPLSKMLASSHNTPDEMDE